MFSFFLTRIYVRLFTALAAGIAAGSHWPLHGEFLTGGWWLYWTVMGAIAVAWRCCGNRTRIASVLPYVLVVLIGYASASLSVHIATDSPLETVTGRKVHRLHGTVASIPKLRNGHLRFMMAVDRVGKEDISGRCFVYMKADSPPELYFTDELELSASVSEIEPPKNRGEFDYRSYMMRKGTVFTAYCLGTGGFKRLTSGWPWPWAQVDILRSRLTGNMRRFIGGEPGELAVSVVFGDKITHISDATHERFRRAGLTHIIVASGTQVSLVIALVSLLFWRFTMDFSWKGVIKGLLQFAITMGVVLVYSSITGFETSIMRAVSMGTLVLAGRLLHRDADGLSILAQSGMVLLIVNPLELFAVGFQLSFGATFGLIYLIGVVHPLYSSAVGLIRAVSGMLASTGGAQLFVAPLLAASFNQLSVWGLLSNLIAIPLAFLLLIGGALLSAGLGYIPLLGAALGWTTFALSWLMNSWAGLFAALPGSDIAVPQQNGWWTVGCYLLLFAVAELFKNREVLSRPVRRWIVAGCIVLGTALSVPVLSWLTVPHPGLSVMALDGCSACIWRPYTGKTVVIAASSGFGRRHNDDKLLDALKYRGINRVHHWYWVGESVELPQEYDGLPIDLVSAAGEESGAEEDLAWVLQGAKPAGAIFQLGRRRILYMPENPGANIRSEEDCSQFDSDYVIDGRERVVFTSNPGGTMTAGRRQNFTREFEINPSGIRQF